MSETTNEETEPQTELVDSPGVPGQILYPDPEVDAERAAAFAGGKEEFLYDPEDDPRNAGWQNPADRSAEVTEEDDEEDTDE